MIGRLPIGLAAVTTPLMAQTIPASAYAARRDSLAARIGRGLPPDSLGVERATGIPARSIAALAPMLPDTPKNRAMIAKVRDAVARYDKTGVRIEDNYLVTASWVEWLSRAPREIAEVEAAMASK